jgi:chromate transporter
MSSMSTGPDPKNPSARELSEITRLFLRLGFTAFGGPAAHIAMLHDETVVRKKWLSDEQFLDLLGATNLIPGPNSTEMAIHVGYVRGGKKGLILAGVCFIAPAMALVLALSWVYTQFNATPQFQSVLYGIKPVIIAVILQALWILGRKAIQTWQGASLVVGLLLLYGLGLNELLLLLLGGLIFWFFHSLKQKMLPGKFLLLLPLSLPVFQSNGSTPQITLLSIFLSFLKIGSVLYGSGYVLLAFLQSEFVTSSGWLTSQQLIDAVAIGQLTPGPVFTTATFIGYILAGVPGALVATAGIFLPAFVFVAFSIRIIPWMRSTPAVSQFLDGVIVASLALMIAVTWTLGRAAIVDPLTASLALLSALLIFRYRVNSTWLILFGAVAGLLAGWLLG